MNQIQKYRLLKGWSVRELAERSGLTQNQVRTVEKGGKYTWNTIVALSDAFGLSFSVLGLNVPSLSEMDKKLWSEFGKYIRLRDSRGGEVGLCISCGRMSHYKESDAGHYISRKHKATKYNELNVNLQCKYCNRHLKGNIIKYRINLVKKYGHLIVEDLEEKMDDQNPLDRGIMFDMTEFYKEEVRKMEADQSYQPKSFNKQQYES